MSLPHLVIAGDDFRFVEPMLPVLEARFEVRFDRWDGPERHDEAASEALLAWADVVWCEWWLGNAVWYSWRLRAGQRLIVRLHLFELTREYVHLTRREALDRVVCVSVPAWADLRRIVALPPGVACVVPNAVAFGESVSAPGGGQGRLRSLALVGAVPARKGLRRAVALLAALREHDPGYGLHVYGRRPDELPWVAGDLDEQAYFRACEEEVAALGLTEAVTWHGWTDMRSAFPQHGFVLSPSDVESFHVAPVEGVAAGAVPVVWPWPGAAWSHPGAALVASTAKAGERILALADPVRHAAAVAEVASWYRERCDPVTVAGQIVAGLP